MFNVRPAINRYHNSTRYQRALYRKRTVRPSLPSNSATQLNPIK